MKRILVRAGKNAWEHTSALETLDRNTIGNNSGNLLFAYAVQRHLSRPGVELVPDRYAVSESEADRINAECESFALPLANSFRKSFMPILANYTKFIQRLKIPVTVIGVGAQATLDADPGELKALAPTVSTFVKAVLDRSTSIGVRGEFTADYLRSLGFRDVEVIGCPSMFLNGHAFKVAKRVDRLTPASRITVNITQEVEGLNAVALANYRVYPDMVYIPQDIDTLRTMVWGERRPGKANNLYSLAHPFFRDDKARFFLDPSTWMEFMRDKDFTFGSRIHGCVVSLQAGTPACLIAHDSRTRELAEVLCIPFVRKDQISDKTDIAELYASLDLERTNREYPRLLANYISFLERNGVEHTLSTPGASSEFDARVATATLAAPVSAVDRFEITNVTERIDTVRTKHARELDALRSKVSTLTQDLAKANARTQSLEARLEALEASLGSKASGARPL